MTVALNVIAIAAAVLGGRRPGCFLPRPSGIASGPASVLKDMTVTQIHQEIEETSERRTELWHELS